MTMESDPGRHSPDSEALDYARRVFRAQSNLSGEDRLLRSVVLELPERYGAYAGFLFRAQDDGRLAVTSVFGHEALPGPDAVLLAESWPVTMAMRQPAPVVCPDHDDVAARFPALAHGLPAPHTASAVRLLASGVPVGALALTFDRAVGDIDELSVVLATLGDLVGLYVARQWERQLRESPALSTWTAPSDDSPRAELTPRQLLILELVAQGLSNGQVAFRIGYSESTVRQETIAIYRALDVSGRHEAVAEARARHILPPAPGGT